MVSLKMATLLQTPGVEKKNEYNTAITKKKNYKYIPLHLLPTCFVLLSFVFVKVVQEGLQQGNVWTDI